MTHTVITLIGGGAFLPRLIDALAALESLPPLELRLTARRQDRLEVIAAHAARRIAPYRPDWRITATPSLEAALDHARFVILLLRAGGLASRAWDEQFPRRFGLIGDEGLGPGGFANAWRTLPVLEPIAAAIRTHAPGATVLNLVAPLGITTGALREAGLHTLGVCELPLVTLEALARDRGVDPARIAFRYGGLNHLGWFWDLHGEGRDLFATPGRPAGMEGPGLLTSRPSPLVDGPTLDRYHAVPLKYFYEVFDLEAGRRLGIERRPGRAEALIDLSETLVSSFATTPGHAVPALETRPTPWFDRAVAPLLAAMLGGPPWQGFLNVPNDTLLPELDPKLVVEVAARIDAQDIQLFPPGPLPAPVARFLEAAGRAEMLAWDAARSRSISRLAEAMQALPLEIAPETALELARLAVAGPGSSDPGFSPLETGAPR